MYGGRRHLPFPVEMDALLVGMGRGLGCWEGREGRGLAAGAVRKRWVAGLVSVPREGIGRVSVREM